MLFQSASLPRQNASNAAARIRDITRIAWDQMYVNMHARLTSRFPDIHADVISVGRVLRMNEPVRLIEQGKNRRLFFCIHVKKACDVALRNYKNVPAAK